MTIDMIGHALGMLSGSCAAVTGAWLTFCRCSRVLQNAAVKLARANSNARAMRRE
ncbi:hypothetical protein K458DRAFT_412482 [Lentithecium fluviatile CBS 122367]|uniref:Uncharacterized protein n=1 Tax=Lentithecium fluviatile CBS 122367 TaxID=1168545 RepID=A0A6G1JM14_9PLEO|nr:hypothetical protein K458DRAFT_412482 [Lentithecium fluviatile CBS 122367]